MKNIELYQPEFLLCQKPLKDHDIVGGYLHVDDRCFEYDIKEERQWVYHLPSESLIEFISKINGTYNYINKHKDFVYKGILFTGVIVKSNCQRLSFDEESVLDQSWLYMESIFKFEDSIL